MPYYAKQNTIIEEEVGVIKEYGGTTAPAGYLFCNGDAVSRTTYARLFAKIGTAFGVGDGSTTFNIPDMIGAAPAGAGTSSGYTQNETIALGTKYDDQMQQITGSMTFGRAGENTYGAVVANSGAFQGEGSSTAAFAGGTAPSNTINKIDFDSADSPDARTGTVTRGKRVGVNFIIKY